MKQKSLSKGTRTKKVLSAISTDRQAGPIGLPDTKLVGKDILSSDFFLKDFFRKKPIKDALEKILKSSKANILSVWARDETTNKIEFITGAGQYKEKDVNKEKQVMEILLRKNKVCAIDINKNEEIKNLSFIKDNKLVSSVVIPMKAGEENIGIILLYNQEYSDLGLDKLNKLFYTEMMAIQNEYLKERLEVLLNTANVDSLTKLYNHRSFYEILIKEISKAHRFQYPLSVLMIDIDHFKDFNDKYGHLIGDRVLYVIAEIIRNTIRAYDIAFRYGGEEIAVICPYTNRRQGLCAAERIRKNVENYVFDANGGIEKAKLTISIGVSSYPENSVLHGELVKKADEALYLAKEEGRNRVCSSLMFTKKIIQVAFCPPAFTSHFYNSVLKGVKEVIEDVGNVKLFVDAPEKESDQKWHRKIIDKFIKMKVDSFAISSQERELMGKKILECNKAGIEVFMFNTVGDMLHGNVISYISYKNKEAGRKVGDYLVRLLRKNGKIAILEGLPEITSDERKKGFMEIINKYKAIKVLTSRRANWERSMARKVTAEIIKEYPNIDAIYGVSDEMALGAVDAVIDAGKHGEIFIIGLDGNPNALESIKKGNLTATLNTNAVGMGRALMRAVLRSKIKGEKMAKHIWLPIMTVDLENVDQFL